MNTQPHITHIDATGLLCPQPLLLLKQAVKGLAAGSVVHIVVTDPHAELDFEIWCERFGHQLSCIEQHQDHGMFAVEVGDLKA
jgi:tRNA 2-thiouridine synthesizing protein A